MSCKTGSDIKHKAFVKVISCICVNVCVQCMFEFNFLTFQNYVNSGYFCYSNTKLTFTHAVTENMFMLRFGKS